MPPISVNRISTPKVANQAILGYSVSMVYFAGHAQTIFRLGIIGSELGTPPLNAPPA